jgi:HK97 family phage prohead protease
MQHNNFRFEIKTVSESGGSFTGLASTYGNMDLQGDAVMPGAFTKTLRDAKGPFPVLMGHDMAEQIGYAQLEDSSSGLLVKGTLVLETEKSRQAYALMKAKALRGMSIGYDTVRSNMKDGVRQLSEVKLYEVSLTPFPANERAVVTGVKDISDSVARFRQTIAQCTKEIRGR